MTAYLKTIVVFLIFILDWTLYNFKYNICQFQILLLVVLGISMLFYIHNRVNYVKYLAYQNTCSIS